MNCLRIMRVLWRLGKLLDVWYLGLHKVPPRHSGRSGERLDALVVLLGWPQKLIDQVGSINSRDLAPEGRSQTV